MISHLALVAAFALGHACLTVIIVNVTHGLGFPNRVYDRVMLPAIGLLCVATIAGGFWLLLHPLADWPLGVRAYLVVCLVLSLIVLPGTTMLRALRRAPAGVGGCASDLALPPGDIGRFVGHGPRAWWLRLPGNESLRPRAHEGSIVIPGLPAELDGLTILHLTDFHFATTYAPDFYRAAAAAAPPADLVLFTGDVVDDEPSLDWIASVFAEVRGRLGSFAILGNHDFEYDTSKIGDAFRAAGYAFIDGSWATVRVGSSVIALGGTSAPWGPRLDPSDAPEAGLRILLSHTPDRFPWAAGHGFDLVFAGHNHYGQIRLPVLGPILMPSVYVRRYDHGWFAKGRTRMYVGAGLGGKHPLRWNCPPEIAHFTLRGAVTQGDRDTAVRPEPAEAAKARES